MKVEWDGKVQEVERSVTAGRLLEMFSLSREAHLVIANGQLMTEDSVLGIDDKVKVVRVISGG